MKISVAIIGNGCVPRALAERSDAVSAAIYNDGCYVGDVTLLPDSDDRLNTWSNGRGHWADNNVMTLICPGLQYESAIADLIVDAVREAAARE